MRTLCAVGTSDEAPTRTPVGDPDDRPRRLRGPRPGAGTHTPASRGPTSTPSTSAAGGRRTEPLTSLLVGVLAAVPVAATLGALPGRAPTVLVETMFRGFTACALEAGALNPFVMVCERAGVPLGMYQLDGGLTYPLGGLFVRAGVDPRLAWQLAVLPLLVVGCAALCWLARRLSGSWLVAAVVVGLYVGNATLTARTGSWYWNTAAVVLLPVVLAAAYALLARARRRRPRLLLAPAAVLLAGALAAGLEWQYAAVFALLVAAGVTVAVTLLGGWTWRQRAALVAVGGAGTAATVAVLRWRMTTAGVVDQFGDALADAAAEGVDLMALVAPDAQASFAGLALGALGRHGMLVGAFSEGRQLWIAPYLGVGLLTLITVLLVRNPAAVRRVRRSPPGLLPLLVALAVGSVVLSLGPEWHVARATVDGHVTSPLAWLWTSTPVRWIRYPWTWNHLTHVTLLLVLAAIVPPLVRRGPGWSPVAVAVLVLAVLELGSPLVAETVIDPRPSVSNANTRATLDDPPIARFESRAVPELHRALADVGGTVTVLPWGNTWIIPHLGPEAGVRVRNVGIDRNLAQVEAAAALPRPRLRDLTGATIDELFALGWTDAVVVLDHIPTAYSIARHEEGRLSEVDRSQQAQAASAARGAARLGHCVERHSWFWTVLPCAAGAPAAGR